MTQNTANENIRQNENTEKIRKPASSRLKFGLKNALAIALVAGSMTLVGLCARKKPGPDKDKRPVKEKVLPKPCPKVPAAPVKGDNVCELDKGEHDPASPNWDPKSCGYCGDDIQQDWETKDTCPVDFLCEKGNESYWKKTFGTYKDLGDGKMVLTTIRVTKRCKKSESNTGRRRRRRTTVTTTPRPMDTTPTVAVKPGGPCRQQPSGQLIAIKRTIRRKLTLKTDYLWNAKIIPREKKNVVRVRLSISATGHVKGVSISASGRSISPSSVGLGPLKGMYIGYPTGSACSIYVNKTIPSGTK